MTGSLPLSRLWLLIIIYIFLTVYVLASTVVVNEAVFKSFQFSGFPTVRKVESGRLSGKKIMNSTDHFSSICREEI